MRRFSRILSLLLGLTVLSLVGRETLGCDCHSKCECSQPGAPSSDPALPARTLCTQPTCDACPPKPAAESTTASKPTFQLCVICDENDVVIIKSRRTRTKGTVREYSLNLTTAVAHDIELIVMAPGSKPRSQRITVRGGGELTVVAQAKPDALQKEREELQDRRDALQTERDQLQQRRDKLQVERDTLQLQRDKK